MSERQATPIDLREQVNRAIEPSLAAAHHYGANTQQRDAATERVLAVFAERERVLRGEMLEAFLANGVYAEQWKIEERARLRERIEALPRFIEPADLRPSPELPGAFVGGDTEYLRRDGVLAVFNA